MQEGDGTQPQKHNGLQEVPAPLSARLEVEQQEVAVACVHESRKALRTLPQPHEATTERICLPYA